MKVTVKYLPSLLEAHVGFFKLCMKGIFDVYLLWPFFANYKHLLISATLRYSFLTACKCSICQSGANCIGWCILEQDTEYLKLCTCEENGWSKNEFNYCSYYPCVTELNSCHTNIETMNCAKRCFSVKRT